MWPKKKKLADYVPDIELRIRDAATFLRSHDTSAGVAHVVGLIHVDGFPIYLILDVRRTTKQ